MKTHYRYMELPEIGDLCCDAAQDNAYGHIIKIDNGIVTVTWNDISLVDSSYWQYHNIHRTSFEEFRWNGVYWEIEE